MINYLIPIPDNQRYIVKEIISTKKNLQIILGSNYSYKKIVETIYPEFTKFKKNLKKSLKDKYVGEKDIIQIISLIEDNHAIIYRDEENIIPKSSSNVTEIQEEDENNQHITRQSITFEEWQSKLNEKYTALKNACNNNFPGIWNSIEFELAILRILNIKGVSLPFAGIVLGVPSSNKTLGIELFRDYNNVYYTDNFSSKAFVSHSTGVPKEQLAEIDLLPKIKNKCLLAPELSPIFAKKDEDLIEILGILTRVLDGHGYESDSGAHGRRGYSGEHMFTMIGAAVDIPHKVHKHLSNLGPKLFFIRMPRSNKTDSDYIKMLQEDNFNAKKQELQEKINDYLDYFDKSCPVEQSNNNDLLKIPWGKEDKDKHNAILDIIVKLAKLLAYLRGTVNVWNTEKTQGSHYGYSTPILEEPDRAMTQLFNLAKGHALSQGRNHLSIEDIPLLIKVVLSTASIERVMIFDLLLASKGTITTSQLGKSLGISKNTALRTMVELHILGIVSGKHFKIEEDDDEVSQQDTSIDNSNEKKRITLNKDFEWFLSEEFRALREGFVPEGKSKYDDKESVKKNSPHIKQKKLFEDIHSLATSSAIQSPPAIFLLSLTPQHPMLPSPRPLLSLPLLIPSPLPLPQQTITKQNKDQELSKSIENFDYTNNQDKLLEDNSLLIITTISSFMQNIKRNFFEW